MKVFFVNPPFKAEHGRFSRENRSPAITRSGTLYYPLWLIYAAAVCERDGFEVEFLDAPAKAMDPSGALGYVAQRGRDTRLFVLDTSTPSIHADVGFAEALKERYPGAKVMLVGTHPSALPEECVGMSGAVDAVARREFDWIVRDYARAIGAGTDFSGVRGVTYRDKGRIVSNPDMPYLDQNALDDIPFAAKFIKEHLDIRDYFFAAAAYPEIQVFTGRGCMSRCSFCVYPQTLHGHQYRLRSPENVVAEFEYIAEHFPRLKEVVIEDDTFTAKKERVLRICELICEKGLQKRLRWLCNARVNLDFETMKAMKRAGCHLIIPGIESGSQRILNNIRKGTTIGQIEAYAADAKKAGLMVHACYMVGNSGETRETMEQTLRLALRLNTDTAQFYPLLPFPGTEAYAWAKSNGYLKGGYGDFVKEDGTINCVLAVPGITSEEMVAFCNDARRAYYWRPRYILHRLCAGLRNPQDLKRSLIAFRSLGKYLVSKR